MRCICFYFHKGIDFATMNLSERNFEYKLLFDNACHIQSLMLDNQLDVFRVSRVYINHSSVIDKFLKSFNLNEKSFSTNKRNLDSNFIIQKKKERFSSTKFITIIHSQLY